MAARNRYSATPIATSPTVKLKDVIATANLNFKRLELVLASLTIGGLLGPSTDGAILRYDGGAAAWITGTTPLRVQTALITASAPTVISIGTIASDVKVLDTAVTWNNSGVAFTAWKLNVTKTAAASNSKLMDLQVDGTSVFKVELAATGSVYVGDFTVPNGQAGVRINQGTVTTSSESALNVTATYNIAGSPDLVQFNISNTASGASTNFFVCYLGGVGVFSIARDGQAGVCGGAVSTSALRVGNAVSVNANGLEVVPKFLTTASPMYVVRITGTADAGTYTTSAVNAITVETFVKAVNQTITTWSGLKILAPPTATNVRAIWTAGGWWLNDSTSSVILSNAALPTSATDGFTYLPTCAGTPTGTPTTQTGTVPMVIDTTNGKIYWYLGGAWKSVTPA